MAMGNWPAHVEHIDDRVCGSPEVRMLSIKMTADVAEPIKRHATHQAEEVRALPTKMTLGVAEPIKQPKAPGPPMPVQVHVQRHRRLQQRSARHRRLRRSGRRPASTFGISEAFQDECDPLAAVWGEPISAS
jgi:hypothetical protein